MWLRKIAIELLWFFSRQLDFFLKIQDIFIFCSKRLDFSSPLMYNKQRYVPVWWNWQTCWTQNPVVAIPYRFDPGHRHQKKKSHINCGFYFLFFWEVLKHRIKFIAASRQSSVPSSDGADAFHFSIARHIKKSAKNPGSFESGFLS